MSSPWESAALERVGEFASKPQLETGAPSAAELRKSLEANSSAAADRVGLSKRAPPEPRFGQPCVRLRDTRHTALEGRDEKAW